MSKNPNQPKEYDLVLGGQNPPPINGLVLGGIEGLRQRFTTGNPEQRIELLANALHYQDAGIEFLIEAIKDPVLGVRATAYNYLQGIDSEKAKQAIANKIIINEGDRIYNVYESGICYNDWCYDLLTSIDDFEDFYSPPQPISRHVFKASAEAAALSHHNWRALQDDVYYYFTGIGWNEIDGLRDSFNIVDFCRNHNVLIRLPGESRQEFEQRIDTSGYANVSTSLKLQEEHQQIYEEWLREDFDVEGRRVRYELEQRTIKSLQASQRYELLGQLWVECVGMLAFVHEEVVRQQSYLKVIGTL